MRKLIFVLFTALLVGCHKESNSGLYWGEANALKNGIPWSPKPFAAFEPEKWGEDYIDVGLRIFDGDDFLREELSFLKIPMEVGVYNIEPVRLNNVSTSVGSSYYTFQDDGHILGDTFVVDTTVIENKVEVLSFNKSEGKIEIKFSATYVISQRQTNESPDTVRFENGYVNTKTHN